MRQPVQRKSPPVGFFFQHEQDRLAVAVGPLHQQGHVELPVVCSQAFLELFLSRWDDLNRVFRQWGLFGGEKRQRVARIVKDQVLEVLVVADGVCHALHPMFFRSKGSGSCHRTRHGQSLKKRRAICLGRVSRRLPSLHAHFLDDCLRVQTSWLPFAYGCPRGGVSWVSPNRG